MPDIDKYKPLLPDIRKHLPKRVQRYLNEEQIKDLDNNKDILARGDISTIQMMCRGKEKCPYGESCPFQNSAPPIGKPCPLEAMYQEQWLEDYIKAYGLDPGKKSHIALVQAIVTTDIELMRARAQLQYEGFEEHIYIEEEDEGKRRVRHEKKLHNLVELIDRLEKRKLQYLRELNRFAEENRIDAQVLDPQNLIKKLRGG